jgi:hypothetical protein
MEDFEITFVKELPKDSENYSIIFGDKKYNGWFRYTIDSEEFTDIVVRFRLPATMPLYGDVARNFLPEERLVGIHRMLIGKDLQEETRDILNHSSVDDYVATLDDEKIKELLDRMKSMVTINCNKVPYLHIRMRKSFGQTEQDFDKNIKEHIASHPSYINLFYDVLNEKITVNEATEKSNGIIFSEYLELTN